MPTAKKKAPAGAGLTNLGIGPQRLPGAAVTQQMDLVNEAIAQAERATQQENQRFLSRCAAAFSVDLKFR
jgi:hypothetical protein